MTSFDIVGSLAAAVSWKFIFFLVPSLCVLILDTLGWRLLLGRHTQNHSYMNLLQLHIGIESLHFSIPGGFAMTDPAKILYLQRKAAIHPVHSLGSLVARRWMIGISQLLFILIGFLFSATAVNNQTLKAIGLGEHALLIIVFAVLIMAVLILVAYLFSRRRRDANVMALVQHIPLTGVKRWVQNNREAFQKTDEYFKHLGGNRKSFYALLAGIYFLSWFLYAVESYAVASYFDIPMSMSQAVGIEALLSIVTLAAFFLPSGAVVKDLGYVGLLSVMAVSTNVHTVMSFIIFKRLITLSWIAIGYILLAKIGGQSILFKKNIKHKNVPCESAVHSSPNVF
jgi:hypothetical protein